MFSPSFFDLLPYIRLSYNVDGYMSASVVECQDLKKHYRIGSTVVRALDGVSITVIEKEFVALLGRSGSGKSTLLNLIAGLDHPTSGSLRIDGVDLAAMSARELSRHRQRSVGIIFQSFNLISSMTALENVAPVDDFCGAFQTRTGNQGGTSSRIDGPCRPQSHRPNELSGGEQQRVAISRALANNPRVLLADEPTGNLDSHTATEMMEVLKDLNVREGKTVILVSHEASFAARYAHRTVALMDGLVQEMTS